MSITQQCSKCGRLIPVSEYSEDGFKRQVCKECERAEQEAAKPKTKVCECCGRELPIEKFYPTKRCKDGYSLRCIECEVFLKSDAEPKFKTCIKCGKTLPTYLFSKDKKGRDGLRSWCKKCTGDGINKTREKYKNTPHPPLDFKVCSHCGRKLPIEMFTIHSNTKDGYNHWCRDCSRESCSKARQKKRMRKLIPGWTAPTQEDIDRSVDNIPTQEDIDNSVDSIPTLPPFPMPTKRPKPTSAIEERKDWLIKSIRESKGDYPKEMLNDFFLYWSEMDANGLSMRFEKECTWETSKRLRRWYLHSQKPSSNTPTPEPQRAVAPTPPKVEQEPISSPTERPTTNLQRCVRSKWLYKQVMKYGQDCPFEMLTDFYKYWSQSVDGFPNLMLFENEKNWNTDKRLWMWKYCCEGNLGNLKLMFPTDKIPQKFQDMLQKLEQEPTPPPPLTPKVEQPVEQATYSPQTLTIRFKAGDKVIRLKDGIFLLEQLSGNLKGSLSSKGAEILYETTDGDMVADKDLFKNKREALERTKLAGIPEERLTYGNKPIK